MDAQRALLDELMGSARNLTEDEKKGYREIRWDDREVCGPFMVRFCPHDLFVNTKSNLGPCPKIHDLKLRECFENSPRHDAYVPKFEAELAQFCDKLVMDLDRKLKRSRERIAPSEAETTPPAPVPPEKSSQLSMLEEKIKKLLEQVETLGEAGKVDEAEALMRMVDTLNSQKMALTQQLSNDKLTIYAPEKKMELCEICGSFLVANDAAERTQSHVTGKQHVGYGMVRDFLSEFKAAKEKAREEERLAREKESEERKKRKEEVEDMGDRGNIMGGRDRHGGRERDYGRERQIEREFERERSREWSRRGSGDGSGREYDRKRTHYRSWREGGREDRNGNMSRSKGLERSRSPSPHRRGQRRPSRSPVRPY